MSEFLIDAFSGTLGRGNLRDEQFDAQIEFSLPSVNSFPDTEGLHARVISGFVNWTYLGLPARITSGAIFFFGKHAGSERLQSVAYEFEFSCEGEDYLFAGEKRFAGTREEAHRDLSTIHAFVTSGTRRVAEGLLTSPIGEMIRGYTGPASRLSLADSARLNHFHDFFNRNLSEFYPHLPPLLIAGPAMPDDLRRTLALLAEVMLPTPLPHPGPAIADVVDGITDFLAKGSGATIRSLRVSLAIINLFIPVLKLHLDEIRAQVAAVLGNEYDNSAIRQALVGVHQIVVFAYYADKHADRMLGYARPHHIPSHGTTLETVASIPDRVFDVAIAGTGPAGSLLAERLSAAGNSVLLLEAGPYVPELEITPNELDSIARLYKNSGLQSATKTPVTVLQGACVGGGGVVNNGIFFPLPKAALEVWQNAGFPFDGKTLGAAYRSISQELNIGDVSLKAERLNPAGGLLEDSLGTIQASPLGPVPPGFYRMSVNLETKGPDPDILGCRSTGLCNLGCGSERKVNSFQHYLNHALDGTRDVTLVPNASVVKVVTGSGLASRRVTAFQVQMPDGSTALARANSFVICCGAVASSGLLLRSEELLAATKTSLPVGKRFCGNVASPIFGVAPKVVNSQTYVQMCHVYVPEPEDDGYLIETWFNPPGGLALAVPGFLDTHAERMSLYPQLIGASPVVGTQPAGTISLRGQDTAIDLPLTGSDLDRLRRGMIRLLEAMTANQVTPAYVRLGNGREIRGPADIDALSRTMQSLRQRDLYVLPLSTAHPQGGNALSDDPSIGVIGNDFRVRGIENLRVCDGSVFPAVAGVNPQWTIYALAHLCAMGFN